MSYRIVLGLLLASCSDPRSSTCEDVKPARVRAPLGDDAALDQSNDSRRRDHSSDCTDADSGYWSGVERRLSQLHARTVDNALVAAVGAMQAMRATDKGIAAEPHRIDDKRGAFFVAHKCGAYSGGARLFLLGQTSDERWGILDSVALPSGTNDSALVASGNGSFVVDTTWMGTQQTISSILLVRARGTQWVRVFARDELINLRVTRTAGGAVANWAEKPRSFTHSINGPQLTFEAMLSLSPSEAPGPVRSTVPWFHALDTYCQKHRQDRRFPCGPDDWITNSVRVGRFAALQIEGTDADISCEGESIGSFIAADRATIVELQQDAGRWTVLTARPADRGCAAARKSTTRATGNRKGSRIIARSPVQPALGVSDRELIWTTEDTAIIKGARPATTRALRDQPLFIAVDAEVVYWISAETGRLRSLRADESDPVTLADLPLGAAGLTVRDGTVYWSMYSQGEVWRFRNGRAEVFASGLEMPMGLVVDGNRLLVATARGLVAIDPDGRVSNLDAEALAPIAVASRNGVVAWIEAGGRVMAASDHGAHMIADSGRPTQIAILSGDVFWVDASDRTVRAARLE